MDQESLEFGVSYGLLTQRSGDVTVSDRLMESLSESSRDQVEKLDSPDLDFDCLWEDAVFYGTLGALPPDSVFEAPLKQFLLEDVGVILTDSLLNLGERAGCFGTSEDRAEIDKELLLQCLNRLALVKDYKSVGEFRRAALREISELVLMRLEASDLAKRHSSLLTLFLLRVLSKSGMLKHIENVFVTGSRESVN